MLAELTREQIIARNLAALRAAHPDIDFSKMHPVLLAAPDLVVWPASEEDITIEHAEAMWGGDKAALFDIARACLEYEDSTTEVAQDTVPQ